MKWGKQVVTDQPISNEPGGAPTEVPSPSACTDYRRTTQMLRSQPLRNTRKQLLLLPQFWPWPFEPSKKKKRKKVAGILRLERWRQNCFCMLVFIGEVEPESILRRLSKGVAWANSPATFDVACQTLNGPIWSGRKWGKTWCDWQGLQPDACRSAGAGTAAACWAPSWLHSLAEVATEASL